VIFPLGETSSAALHTPERLASVMDFKEPYQSPTHQAYTPPSPAEGSAPAKAPEKPKKNPKWQAIQTVCMIIGFFIAMVVRVSLGLHGMIPGAIFGALGAGGGAMVAVILQLVIDPKGRM
jgi:hypothetical protein